MTTFTHKTKNTPQNINVPRQDDDSSTLKPVETTPIAASSENVGLLVLQDKNLVAAHRLVVLIPNLDVDEAELAREIWKLAFPPELAVLLLGLCPNVTEEPRVRRRLVTIAALTRDQRVPVEIQLEFGRNWIGKLKAVLEVGDIVVYHNEQRIGFWRQPLELPLARLNIPTVSLKGFIAPIYKSSTFLRESVFWSVAIVILFVFFLSQIRILRISEEWARDILLSLSILIELGLFLVWNNLSH